MKIPGAGAPRHAKQPFVAVHILVGAIAEDLAQWCGEILGVARGDAAGRLGGRGALEKRS
jgi:hypothetical protein